MTKGGLVLARMGLIAAVACGVSCGGGDGAGGTCGTVAACGGDIVGNWRITGSCLKISGLLGLATCPGATLDASLHLTGTASYAANLTYVASFVVTGSETIGFPASCLTTQGITLTCDQLNQTFTANPPSPSVSSIRCSAVGGGGCNCVATLIDTPANGTGTYTTAGGIVTTTPTGGMPDTGDQYCVKGSRLDVTAPAMTDGTLTESGSITLMRQ